jgi:hypothetical protein
MNHFDITQTNAAVERLIETTKNPRHLYLLHAYNRHRNLEMAGLFEEIFTPEMTVENPVYHFNVLGATFTLDGAEASRGSTASGPERVSASSTETATRSLRSATP